MDKLDARFYRSRWKDVEEIELTEIRRQTVEERWNQLNFLIGMANALGLEMQPDEAEIQIARQRWLKLKRSVNEEST